MRQFACNMGKGQNFVFHSCFIPVGPRIPIFGIPVTVSATPSTWPMVLRTPRAHPCGWSFNHFHLFTRSTKSSWICTLFITSLSLNDVIRRYFIGAFLYDDRNHWSSFRFISRLDFMEESRENLYDILLIVNYFATKNISLYLCAIFLTSFCEKRLNESVYICSYWNVLSRWTFRNQRFLSFLRDCEIGNVSMIYWLYKSMKFK